MLASILQTDAVVHKVSLVDLGKQGKIYLFTLTHVQILGIVNSSNDIEN